jgi:rhamnogalacturonyl hydrolase YesR
VTDLVLTPNIDGVDDFYAELLAAHDGLEKEQSDALSARLILILANHIGERSVLSAAIKAAEI